MDPNRLQQHVFGTYVTLRYGLAVLTLLFPLAVYLAGYFSGVELQQSLSAYYWADRIDPNTPRAFFVGLLFAVAVGMYLYKGFTHAENIALNIAAVFAVLVALVPMRDAGWNPGKWHGTFAISMFVCLTYVVWFRAGDTLSLLPADVARGSALRRYSRAWYQWRYRVIGSVMLLSPVSAAIVNTALGGRWYVFFIESAGIWAFGWYWFAKSSELRRSLATKRALEGRVHVQDGEAREAAPDNHKRP
jgi:hypothetical protein